MSNPFETLRDMGADAPLLYMITTGAGAGLQKKLWEVPGVSNFFVGASMPYATEETHALLGFTPDLSPRGRPEYASVKTAIDLAMAAYGRAWKPGRKAMGLGMTCSVASTTAHKGAHRIIVALFTDDDCWYISSEIPKGEGAEQRVKDGAISDLFAEYLLQAVIGGPLEEYVSILNKLIPYPPMCVNALEIAQERLFAHPLFRADGTRGTLADINPKKTVIYAGAFNPPHDGHFGSADASLDALAKNLKEHRVPVFATTVNPPHKTALTTAEALQRAKLMKGHNFVVTKDDPLFIDKAKAFPGAYFVMGADAMDRFLDPKWGAPIQPMLDEFARLGTKFLVPGRLVKDEYLVCGRVLSNHWADVGGRTVLFVPVDFRFDRSSSEIRAGTIKFDSAWLTATAAQCAKEEGG